MLKYLKLMRKLGHWHIYNWYRVLIGPGEGRRCVRMITAFRIVLKKCFVFQCSGSRPIFAWEKRKSGLEDAKMNISVGALALNAHNEHFWQFFVFRRSIIEAASVLGGISKFGYVHFINDIAFHHTNCNCHWIYVRLGPISSINRVKTEFSPLFPPTQIECARDELFAVDLFVDYSYIFWKETEFN